MNSKLVSKAEKHSYCAGKTLRIQNAASQNWNIFFCYLDFHKKSDI